MTAEIVQLDYRHGDIEVDPMVAADTLRMLRESGMNLIDVSEVAGKSGGARLELIARDTEQLASAAAAWKIRWSARETGFLIRGENLADSVIPAVLQRLANARIAVRSLHVVAVGAARCEVLLRVSLADTRAAAKVLSTAVSSPAPDLVDLTSEESFPASDAPAWAASRSA